MCNGACGDGQSACDLIEEAEEEKEEVRAVGLILDGLEWTKVKVEKKKSEPVKNKREITKRPDVPEQ